MLKIKQELTLEVMAGVPEQHVRLDYAFQANRAVFLFSFSRGSMYGPLAKKNILLLDGIRGRQGTNGQQHYG
jgi:hypothetical protein